MNSLYVPFSREILTLVALVGGKKILLTLQVKILTLSHPPTHVANNSMS